MFHGYETSGNNRSIWFDQVKQADFPSLKTDIQTDICIIGAGIAGLTTAYLLAKAGKKVIVIDDGKIGSGETGRTTAHLTHALDDRYFEIADSFGKEGAHQAANSHTAAIRFISDLVQQEKIDCDFVHLDGYLYLHSGDDISTLKKELAACHEAGLTEVELLDNTPRGLKLGPCLRFPNQAQFHPLKYLNHLAKLIVEAGGQIFEMTHAEDIDAKLGVIKTTHQAIIKVNSIVIATNPPIYDHSLIFAKQAAYRTYVIGLRVKKDLLPTALLWDTGDPYHYLRLQSDPTDENYQILIIGGEDHRTGQPDHSPEEKFLNLERWALAQIPQLENVVYRWSGQVMEPADYMGLIGRYHHHDNIYVITGDSGNGMTHGTLAGLLITDLIQGRDNNWASLYDPNRLPKNFSVAFQENMQAVSSYLKYFAPNEVKSIEEIPVGSGAIMGQGLHKKAIYRDHDGNIHERSAICTHLKDIVRWNACERTWDCPAHGSRFTALGEVICGPANTDLAKNI